VAAASLSHATCTAGVGSIKTALALARRFKFRAPIEPSD
jgi:hypothetical protein